ncbi:far upstream element-binding protein 1 isoform X3 [Parasteatoda tepidariorum]|uniref:far upstream element-binding protein 1 isoform X3 n=2 Tax=Parasteatoda tepidariorum TaxID=114398 RepID=UPI001C7270AD|nr:far upstream element-binding protein 1 isoform X3 [Parasteatoda tepidariorum]
MSDSSVKSSAQKSNNSGGNETNPAFADAVQRARQLAAKIQSSGSENSVAGGTKRPLEDSMNGVADGTPEIKKMATNDGEYDAYSQIQGMPQRNGGGDFIVEEYRVPDKMVGLIIGRGGEQIIRLQTETGCKIQLAPDSGGAPDRPCTLTGSRESVQAVKAMIDQIIKKANSPYPPDSNSGGGGGGGGGGGHMSDGQYTAEMMIPGPKVGLLIGKGGENIRNLQEKGGVKMVLIQDGPQQTVHDKPLRISGDPQKVEFAKQMVIDLLAQKEMERNYANGGPSSQEEIMVPRQAVGVVIGKNGDMIKRIQQDSGARVQFIQGKEDIPGDKICQVTGTMDQVQKAGAMIRDLIQSVLMGGNSGGGMGMPGGGGRGRGRGRGGMGGPGGMRPDFGPGGPRMGRPGGGGGGGGEGGMEIQFPVPANKCGLVIGKGGETVKSINQQSGAHVEIARGAPPSPHEKVFTIRGNPQQIEHAKQLIMERVGGMPPGQGGPPPGQGGPPGGPQGQYPGAQYQQQYQQPGPGQQYAAPGWPSGGYQAWPNQQASSGVQVAASNDPNKVAADANAAAWAAYYAQFYSQPGQPQAQPQPNAIAQAQPQAQPASQPQASSGQADYSAAWVEYYRSLGMYREAELIEQQSRGGQAPSVPAGPQGQPGAPTPQPSMSQPPNQPAMPTPAGTPAAQPASAPVAAAGYPGAYPAPGQQPQPAQVPYGQPAPYPGYSYAAAYGAQQPFQAAVPQ